MYIHTGETPTRTSNKNCKILDDDDFAENIIASIKVMINERADGLQASIDELK